MEKYAAAEELEGEEKIAEIVECGEMLKEALSSALLGRATDSAFDRAMSLMGDPRVPIGSSRALKAIKRADKFSDARMRARLREIGLNTRK